MLLLQYTAVHDCMYRYIREINRYWFVDAETIASISTTFSDVLTVFSSNFSSAGKGPFMAS